MHIQTKKDQLVEEFHVQLYSSGRIEWDNLDAFIPKWAINQEGLKEHLRESMSVDMPAVR